MRHVSYTIYPSAHDPAPGRGDRPAFIGLTFNPTPCLTLAELDKLIADLQSARDEMGKA